MSAAEVQSVVYILTSYAQIFETTEHGRRLTELEHYLEETRTYQKQLNDFIANSKSDKTGGSLK